MATQKLSGRAAALARRNAQIEGKMVLQKDANQAKSVEAVTNKPVARNDSNANANTGRNASRQRRQALATHGKKAVGSTDRQRSADDKRKSVAKASKEDCDCGCNGAGACEENKNSSTQQMPVPTTKTKLAARRPEANVVKNSSIGRLNSRLRRQALSKHGKSGADIFRKGLSSAQLVKQANPEISGRELAKSVRAMRSNNGSKGTSTTPSGGRQRPKRPADAITGTKVAHSVKTTGDETGLCRSVTGTDYLSSEVFSEFCQKDIPKVPPKVELTETMRGNKVTSGGKVGVSGKVTGNEQGKCRSVTGTEYLGSEHFSGNCQTRPEPGSAKVSFSQTTRGQIVSGSKPARSSQVTGDEAGTCKAVTGTPYAGMEQYDTYCKPGEVEMIQARSWKRNKNNGREISGMQPGLAGLTGAEKGACETVSGTPYIGASEKQAVCNLEPAQIGDSDFPQALSDAPWGAFSLITPTHASVKPKTEKTVTGTSYEQGRISGTFSRGEGKVTGTEQFRFGDRQSVKAVSSAQPGIEVQQTGRITGEGIDTGLKITGDDWDRGDRVTGTEGMSATKRNPTRRGPTSAMPVNAPKRNENIEPVGSRVTGGSGNTEKGAPVTVSGGARG